jgi:hypothetical protein
LSTTITKVVIRDVIDSPVAVSTEKAQRVYKLLEEKIGQGETVELSFAGIESVITAFLNTAVGQLYGKFSPPQLRRQLRVTDAAPNVLVMLKRTTDNAKRFFKNPEPYRQAYRDLERLDAC